MLCKCGSKFLPILKNQNKCLICMVLEACKKNKKEDKK